ncbi:MAG: 50S ribosomal protein L18 [Verrucomicrobiota bacterium]
MITRNRSAARRRLKRSIRLRLSGTSERPRLTVYRSLRHVYAQIVDDSQGKTLVSVSDLSRDVRDRFKEARGQAAVGKLVGQLTARKALEKNITVVVFDRNGYRYHGVVKAMADGAREGGLKF